MLKLRENKGITIITLVVMVTVLLILIRVSFVLTTDFTSQIKKDNYFSEMMTIKAKAKVIAKEIKAEIWNISDENQKQEKRNELYEQNYNMIKEILTDDLKSHLKSSLSEQTEGFVITSATLKKMGITDVSEENNYIMVCDTKDYTDLDIIYKPGIQAGNKTYYSLSEVQSILD